MKRIIWVLIMIPFIFSIASASEDNTHLEAARNLANYLEDHYSVTILIGEDCKDIFTEGFEIGDTVSGRTPLLNLLAIPDYEHEVKLLDDCFAFYPTSFFEHFKCSEAENGIRFLLPNRILAKGQTMAGVTTVADGYYNIFLGVGAYDFRNVHHEIWHAMEYRITAEYPDVFDSWDDLNPTGFEYDDDYFAEDIWTYAEPKDDWFVRGYSAVNEFEDRATVIEAVFIYDDEWWTQHEHIKEKLNMLKNAALPIFGNVYDILPDATLSPQESI